jgi:tetratricopeptide (TPR) repeat protein
VAAERKRPRGSEHSRRRSPAPRRKPQRSARKQSGRRPDSARPGGAHPDSDSARERRRELEIPPDVSSRQLSGFVRRQLRGLPERVAEMVGQHLVMAGHLIDDDPALAHDHALAARSLAARVGVVREACGETAYAAGRYADALAELRAARRMTGSWAYLPMMADCERALGRPERAIRLSQESAAAQLDDAGKAELTIVAAGARRDMGQPEAALQLLESAPLSSQQHEPWVARLRYAYADTLESVGRLDDAVEWFHRTVAVDDQSATDATERLAAIEGHRP